MNIAELREQFPQITMDEYAEAYMAEVLAVAEERGLTERLVKDLTRLVEGDRRVTLYKDFAPLSFTVQLFLKDRSGEYTPWLFGGFIFHERGGGTGAGPEFSVMLGGVDESMWALHT